MFRTIVLSLCLLLCTNQAVATPNKIILSVSAKSGSNFELDDDALAKLPQKKMLVPTPWFSAEQTFEGPLLRDVLKLASIQNGNIKLIALNDYAISIPASDAFQYDVIVARKRNGKLMTIRDKGPLFIMYPFQDHAELRVTEYFRRCSWQLRSIKAE
ncbi:molybdopterin-dependent oxidoreductase [Iodobacter sp.]|uniref:molybdopterin-dependent oxidoreductase n=1 Tax=Iodobacter sp. TaxID=1915058 RepID=UPI0025DBD205|nr:molybdopterin-dependent oxidoreductase [Iodobacter sp.]